MHSHTVSIGAQEISYLESEGTGRPVIFVHGNSSSAPASDHADYSLPGYAGILTGFARNAQASQFIADVDG